MFPSQFHQQLFRANELSSQVESMLLESGGEITPEIEELLTLKELDQNSLVEQTDLLALSLERMQQTVGYYKSQIEHLETLIKGLETTEGRLSSEIQGAMEKLNVEAIEGHLKTFKLRKSPPKVEILDELAIDPEFKNIKFTESVNRKAIGEALKAGQVLHWARLTQGRSLTIQTAKPKQLKESENE